MAGLVVSQIGCAGKVQKISAPLDQIKFEKDYKYAVKLKMGTYSQIVQGDQIQNGSKYLILKNKDQNITLMDQDIQHIEGKSTIQNGTQMLKFLAIGAGAGIVVGAGIGLFFGFVQNINRAGCNTEEDCKQANFPRYMGISSGIVGGAGALVGAGVGAFIPKYDRVQITPIINPITSGVDAGVNVGIKF